MTKPTIQTVVAESCRSLLLAGQLVDAIADRVENVNDRLTMRQIGEHITDIAELQSELLSKLERKNPRRLTAEGSGCP